MKKYKKILMLDFDGVLNNEAYLKEKTLAWLKQKKAKPIANTLKEADMIRMVEDLDITNIKNLQKILKAVPDLRIVLSTTWRVLYDFEDIRIALKKFGIPKYKIIGKTPHQRYSERCHEVLAWIADNNFKGTWAAIDDTWIFFNTKYKKHEFHTSFLDGLTEEIADNIIKYFKKVSRDRSRF